MIRAIHLLALPTAVLIFAGVALGQPGDPHAAPTAAPVLPTDATPSEPSASGPSERGPAGNAHPASQVVSDVEAEYPFGTRGPTTFTVDAKREFAREVDLRPLKDLAVFHNGRIKIVETLARETVSEMAGRKDFVDFKVDDEGNADKFHYDPVFTFFDLVIDPGYYVDKPLIHVEFLPLREAYLERIYEDPEEREWWKRLGRLKPADLVMVGDEVEQRLAFDAASLRSRRAVQESFHLFNDSWRNLLMVPPRNQETQWHHLSELREDSPAGAAVRELGRAWRAGDAPATNSAIQTLAAELPKINPQTYPDSKLKVEAVYNRLNAFEWGYWLYAIALVTLLLAFGTGRRWLTVAGVAVLFIALGMHSTGFIARCIIAERYAIQNQFESMTGISLFAVVLGSVLMLWRRQWLFGAAAAGVGFMCLITATQSGIPGMTVEREAAILNTSVLLKYHVTTVLVSYALIALGFMISLFYLGTYFANRHKIAARIAAATGRSSSVNADRSPLTGLLQPRVALAGADGAAAGAAPPIEEGFTEVSGAALGMSDEEVHTAGPLRVLADLDKAQIIILQLAFWTLGVGILLGAWWADHSWGRWWGFDAKETWALVTWIVYLIVIHVRLGLHGVKRGYWTAILSVIGFVIMLWTYFGVNLLLPGLHAYA